MRAERSRIQALIVLLSFAQFLLNVDFSVVQVALPSIAEDLGFPAEGIQWIITAYSLTFGGFLLLGGRAGDLYGCRRLFVVGLLLLATASAIGGLATVPVVLVGARAFQGLGAALCAPAGLAMINIAFSDERMRQRALSTFGALSSLGFVFGVLLGGAATEFLSWRLTFLANIPLCAIACAAIGPLTRLNEKIVDQDCRSVPSTGSSWIVSLDAPGAILASAAVVFLLLGFDQASQRGWSSAVAVTLMMGSVACGAAFIKLELRTRRPMLPPRLLLVRTVAIGNTVAVLMSATGVSFLFVLTLHLQDVIGLNPLHTAFVFLPVGVSALAGGMVVNRLLALLGVRWVLVLGMSTFLLGMLVLTRIDANRHIGVILAGATLAALGNVLSVVAFTLLATSGLTPTLHGIAAGLINAAQQIGAAVGVAVVVAVMSTVASTRSGAQPEIEAAVAGQRAGLWTGVVFILAGVGLALLAPTGSQSRLQLTRRHHSGDGSKETKEKRHEDLDH